MTSFRLGANALSLPIVWNTRFIPMGTTAQPVRDGIFLDVGGNLCPGILDQHHASGLGASATELVYTHPEFVYEYLLGKWLDRYEEGQKMPETLQINIITHENPDFDALTAIWLVRILVETGDFPPIAHPLVSYVSEVDQGKYKIDINDLKIATHAVHMAYLAIQNIQAPKDKNYNQWCIERGIQLLDLFTQSICTARGTAAINRLTAADLHPWNPGVDTWREDIRFADAKKLLDEDFLKYISDKKSKSTKEQQVNLPSSDGHGEVTVNAFICSAPPTSILNKYWVRANGFPYFICPYESINAPRSDTVEGAPHFPRVVLSLDPTWLDTNGRKPTLKGLGFALEAAECVFREAHRGDDRHKVPRWKDGSTTNADPWYDGRGHDYAIIDTPNSGTHLTLHSIIAIATGPFWHLPLLDAHVWVLSPITQIRIPEANSKKMETIQKFLPIMWAWFHDCETLNHKQINSTITPPSGLKVVAISDRVFPRVGQQIPSIEITEIALEYSGKATLENLVDWCQSKLKQNAYVFASIKVHQQQEASQRADQLLRMLCTGGSAAGSNQDLTLFNGRAVAMRPSDDPIDRSTDLLEVLLYAAFQAESLAQFSQRAGDAVDARHNQQHLENDVRTLLQDFLIFQSKYFHVEIVKDELVRQVYLGLRDSLGLDRLHTKVSSELDRLNQIEKYHSQNQMEILLFFIGLTGIISTCTINLDEVRFWQWQVAIFLSIIAGLLFWRIKSRRDTIM